jgi:elongation factor G
MFNAKAIDRFGKVADGNTTMDFDAEEIRRKFSINTALAAIEWNDCKINLLDTPGYFDFVGEVYQGLRVADGAVVLVPAKDGVAVGTEKSVKYLRDRGLPVVFFIGKMDEENANFERSLTQLQTNFGNQVKPFFLPILEGGKMKGFVDILTQKAFMNGANGVATEAPIPAGMVDEAAVALEAMKEHAAESDEALMEKFFSGEEFTPEEMLKGLSESIVAGTVYPVFCGSAGANWGMRIVMDRLVALLPTAISAATVPAKRLDGSETSVKIDPTGPLAAIVFKTIADPFVGRISMFRVYSGVLKANSTVYNPVTEKDERVGSLFLMIGKKQVLAEQVAAGDIGAVTKLIYTSTNDTLCEKAKPVLLPRTEFPTPCLSMAVEGKAKGDDEKISAGLHKLKDEDPVFTMGYNAETHQLLLAGIGEQHLDVLISKLKSKFNVEATLIEPRVPYRETIRKKVRVEGKHKKQSGGHGQFGHVWVEFEPGPAEGLTFEEHIFGGSVPKQYHPGVEKGLQDAIKKGVLAGYPMVHLKASLVDGSYHDVDSSEMAFKIAARLAYKAGIPLAGPVLLEPICTVDVYIPDSNLGDIMGDMNKRRGRIVGVNPIEHGQEVVAEVPQSEMAKYANDLRSMTQGRGWYKIAFARYDTAPQLISDKVIAEAKLHMKEEEEED